MSLHRTLFKDESRKQAERELRKQARPLFRALMGDKLVPLEKLKEQLLACANGTLFPP
jgi:hypothetical protein